MRASEQLQQRETTTSTLGKNQKESGIESLESFLSAFSKMELEVLNGAKSPVTFLLTHQTYWELKLKQQEKFYNPEGDSRFLSGIPVYIPNGLRKSIAVYADGTVKLLCLSD